MNDNLRRRKAAFMLRQRAADALDQASRLDGLPAMRLLLTDPRRIAEAAGCDPERLADAALALYPGNDDTTTEADDALAGTADLRRGRSNVATFPSRQRPPHPLHRGAGAATWGTPPRSQ